MPRHQSDIEKYVSGRLSAREENELEKKALNDPFVSDALEGAEQISADAYEADVGELHARLEQRIKRGKVVPMWRLVARIAAGLLLVVLTGYFLYGLLDKPDQPIASSNTAPDNEPTTITADTVVNHIQRDTIQDNFQADAAHAPRVEEKARTDEDLLALDQPTQASDLPVVVEPSSEGLAAPTQAAEESRIVESDEEGFVAKKSSEDRDVGRSKMQSAPSVAQERSASEQNLRVITGQVISGEDLEPMPGVNVIADKSNQGAVTDAEGKFKISVAPSDRQLTLSFIGMQPKEVPLVGELADDPDLQVTLQPDVAQLSEVVVVGYSDDLAYGTGTLPTLQLASPKGGKRAFQKYLESNIRYPKKAVENKVEGKVTVQFSVQASGDLSDFKVLKGIGYGCDEEVIRLIKEGPAWQPTRRTEEPVADKVKVRVRFSLKNKD